MSERQTGGKTVQTLPKRLRVKPYLPLGLLEAAGDEEERGIGQHVDHHAGTWDQSLRSAGQPRGTGHPAVSGGDEPVLAPRSLSPLLTSVFPSPTKSFPCLIDTGASTLPNREDSARVLSTSSGEVPTSLSFCFGFSEQTHMCCDKCP